MLLLCVTMCNHHRPGRPNNPDGNTLRLAKNRILADLGGCRNGNTGGLTFEVDWAARRDGRWNSAQKNNWLKIVDLLQAIQAAWLFDGPEDLLASRHDRRYWAEERIRELVPLCALEPSPTARGNQVWGTDGSMVPASVSLCEARRVTAAVTGPSTLVVQLDGRNLSIPHAGMPKAAGSPKHFALN
ncbi:hypothetical protein C8J57DRAFT_1534261 [Mycena rebaudengoi]|nr:hypothetical protein C8J57DRAFT_1534261 [Mycena rebaudengoi]